MKITLICRNISVYWLKSQFSLVLILENLSFSLRNPFRLLKSKHGCKIWEKEIDFLPYIYRTKHACVFGVCNVIID